MPGLSFVPHVPKQSPLPCAAHAVVPVYGVPAGTLVDTIEGMLPVEYLAPGDRVMTHDMGAMTLHGLTACVLPEADVICIGEGALGHDRPGRLLVLPASQPVLVRDWRAEALFGRATALIPAARLADGRFVRRESRDALRVFTLHFARPHVIRAEGVELASAPGLNI